ncbi:hypothetical protein BGX28_005638 [Mortierella sp. GBA30]|nr:hypothetical protein BGX28_005638 [Mortierella sp. GBA30]
MSKARESFLRYQLPLPRVSAFLPQGLDWALQRHDDDDDDLDDDEDEDEDEEDNIRIFLKTSFQDSPPISGDSKMNNHPGSSNNNEIKNESLEMQGGSWSQERDSMPTTDLVNSSISSPGMLLHQPIWPSVGTMEPAKVAAIDMWRRSLLSPLLMDETGSISDDGDSEDDSDGVRNTAMHRGRVLKMNTAMDGHNARDPIPLPSSQSHPKRFLHNEMYNQSRADMENSLSSSASSFEDQECGPFVPHISLGGLENAPSGLGIHPHEQPQQYGKNREVFAEEEYEVPAPELLKSGRFTCFQKTQLSSEIDSGTNRGSFMALTNNSCTTFPNRDSYLNINTRNSSQNLNSSVYLLPSEPTSSSKEKIPLPPAVSAATTRPQPNKKAGKTGILTSILKKRPSLPGLDTAVLAAAVAEGASAASKVLLKSKKRIATFATESSVIPEPQQWSPTHSNPSSSQRGSSRSHQPVRDSDYVFPDPQGASTIPVPNITNNQAYPESVGPLSLPTVNVIMTSELNKGPFGLSIPRLSFSNDSSSATTTTNAAVATTSNLPPPARPPRKHPLDIRFLRKSSLAAQGSKSASSSYLSSPFGKKGSLSSTDILALSSSEPQGPLLSTSNQTPFNNNNGNNDVRSLTTQPPQDILRRSSEPAVSLLGLRLDLVEDNAHEDLSQSLDLTTSSPQTFVAPAPPVHMSATELRISPFDVLPGTPVDAFFEQLFLDQVSDQSKEESVKANRVMEKGKETERKEMCQATDPQSQYQQQPYQQFSQQWMSQDQEQHEKELIQDKVSSANQGAGFNALRRSSSSTSCSKSDVLEFHQSINAGSDSGMSDESFRYF